MLQTWVLFALCSATILFTGMRLAHYGDVLADKSGLGRTWVGVVLMASVTSLPELVTGLSSIAIYDVPNIAVGDIVGSCMFNLLILAMMDATHGLPLAQRVSQGQVLPGAFGALMLSVSALGLLAGARAPAVGWVGAPTLACLGLYVIAMRTVFRFERERASRESLDIGEPSPFAHISTGRVVAGYTLNAALLVLAATFLPGLGQRIATLTGLGETFVGSLFVALSTSLPEVVVSMGSLRIGAVDMAVGNLLGSNLFNLAILGLDDIVYAKGPLLVAADPRHVYSVVAATAMTAMSMAGIAYRRLTKRWRLGWDSVGLIALYLLTLRLLAG